MSPTIAVLQPGPLSTVQDCGRHGYQRLGVSVSGAMDQDALLLGNRLVGNDPCAAAIEVTFGAAAFQFDQDVTVSVTGADLGASLDGLAIPSWCSVAAPSGSVITFDGPRSGLRAYLCVSGGIATTPHLGSRSTQPSTRLGGLRGLALAEGDVLPVGEPDSAPEPGWSVPTGLRPAYGGKSLEARVIPGPQEDAFSAAGVRQFYGAEYIVTDRSDRQGIRLDGPVIEASKARYDIVSDAVAVGSIQVPGDGRPIVLMADRQTTGGYAKIGVIASVDLPLLAQATPGTRVRFVKIDVGTAQKLQRDRCGRLISGQLLTPTRGRSRKLAVNGIEYEVGINAFPALEAVSFADVRAAGESLRVHVQRLPSETEA